MAEMMNETWNQTKQIVCFHSGTFRSSAAEDRAVSIEMGHFYRVCVKRLETQRGELEPSPQRRTLLVICFWGNDAEQQDTWRVWPHIAVLLCPNNGPWWVNLNGQGWVTACSRRLLLTAWFTPGTRGILRAKLQCVIYVPFEGRVKGYNLKIEVSFL